MLLIALQLIMLPLIFFGKTTVYIISSGLLIFFYCIPSIRYTFFHLSLYRYFSKYLPKISETEKAALVAGDPWLASEAMKLYPNWGHICSGDRQELTEQEQYYLETVVDEFCSICNDWEMNKNGIPESIYTYVREHKLWGLIIPKQYDGLDFSAKAQSAIISKIASKSMNAAIIAMVPNSLGPAELLIKYGTEEQKKQYLSKLASGKEIPCFGLTSTTAGSDATSISDNGVICYKEINGKLELGICLTVHKRYITMAPIATIISIAIKLYDPENILSEISDRGITLCLLPANHHGVQIGEYHQPMGFVFPNGTIKCEDVFIPIDWVIGGMDYIGKGWTMLMECLSVGRALSLPALSVGMSQKAVFSSVAYASVREQFNLPVINFEGVQDKLAKNIGISYIIRATNEMTINALDKGCRPSVESAISKYHLTEFGRLVINNTMDILAGKAIQLGPNNFFGECYKSLPIAITVEGANILTRNLIIFGQGIMQFHPYLITEVNCFDAETKANVNLFNMTLLKHSARILGLLVKHIYYILISPWKVFFSRDIKYKHQINKFSNTLSILSEFMLVYLGKRFKVSERVSALLGDMLSYIYIGYAVFRCQHTSDKDYESYLLYSWAMEYVIYNILVSFKDLFVIFPNKFVGNLMRFLLFPFGISSNKKYLLFENMLLTHVSKAKSLNELTEYCYRKENSCGLDILEEAFLLLDSIKSIQKKLKRSNIGMNLYRTVEDINKNTQIAEILEKEELALLLDYTRKIEMIIKVDTFNQGDA